jgi:acyl transferase domain-containing protein
MDAQIKLIEDTYRRAGLDIRETGYVEAHVSIIFLKNYS